MDRVEVVHWNPRRPIIKNRRVAKIVPVARSVNNFGDLIGPLVVDLVLRSRANAPSTDTTPISRRRVLTVGSILHLASSGDTVWGSGWNGKIPDELHEFTTLDVRAVRGPLTREKLLKRGLDCPEVYGDPALLLPRLAPELFTSDDALQHEVLVVPNLHDYSRAMRRGSPFAVLDPKAPLRHCLSSIAASTLVVGSSLHGIIVAEALGIPARLISSGAEHPLKYEDYFNGTGREAPRVASSIAEAVEWGGAPGLQWDPARLIAAFPWDLWDGERA